MNLEDFQNQIRALGDNWGVLQRGLFTTITNKWAIDIYENELKEELIKLQKQWLTL